MNRVMLTNKLKKLYQLSVQWQAASQNMQNLNSQYAKHFRKYKKVSLVWWASPEGAKFFGGLILAWLFLADLIALFWPGGVVFLGVPISAWIRFVITPLVLVGAFVGPVFLNWYIERLRESNAGEDRQFSQNMENALRQETQKLKAVQRQYQELGGENFYPSQFFSPEIIDDVHNLIAQHRASSVGAAINLREQILQQRARDQRQRQHCAQVEQNQRNAIKAQMLSDMATRWAIDDAARRRY